MRNTDVLIIGTGLAGLASALKICKLRPALRVLIVAKEKVSSGNTAWAQGGIAAVTSSSDSFHSHVDDTLRAGAGLCREDVVRRYVEEAPERIQDLLSWGVHFDQENGSAQLTREGGHSERRILHFEDQTGAEIHSALLARCREHTQIEILEEHFAIDLIVNKQLDPTLVGNTQCVGAYVLNRNSGEVLTVVAPVTILATGGAGKVYRYTSNWSGATGDGIAMAWRAGARVANLEFMQFHPTCLYHPKARNFLISEALRGEGGELVNAKGEAFLKRQHPLGSLAPRDIVARGIDAEIKKSGEPCVFLDITHHSREFLQKRFPHIMSKCQELGIDIATQPIPVVPAAHYLCGGVLSDYSGQTDLQGLWAVGETSCTGLHGANRLASNSLLECLAMAHHCSQQVNQTWDAIPKSKPLPPDWEHPPLRDEDEMIVIHHMWDEIRTLMWNYVGIVRSNKRLERASHRLQNIQAEVRDYYSNFRLHSDILELRNIALVAELSVACARRRPESRGIHFNMDYPWAAPESKGKNNVLWPGSDFERNHALQSWIDVRKLTQ